MKKSTIMVRVAMAAFTFCLASGSEAGEVNGITWFSGVASVAGTGFAPPSSPNNDDVAGASDNVITVLQKDYTGIGPVDLVFDVIDTGGTTEYHVIEGVSNSSTLDWSGYHIELGFGTGASFVKSLPGDGLDFDAPDFNSPVEFNPSPGFFPSVLVTEDDIIASGGIHPYPYYALNYEFPLDIPDGITNFTLRQSPIAVSSIRPIPEPSTFALMLMSLAVLRLRRKQSV